MLKRGPNILLLGFLLILLAPSVTNAADKVKNVVIFFSHSPSVPGFQIILDGFKSTFLENNDQQVNFFMEYLDLGRSENDDYARHIIDMYNRKFKEIKIDLFITIGPGINPLLLKYGDEGLKSVDRVSIDGDIPGRISLQELNVKTGKELLIKYRITSTLKLALALFPDHRDVFVISGNSKIDAYVTSLVQKSSDEFKPSYNFHFMPVMTMDSTVLFVKRIPEKSLVFVLTYFKGAGNIPYSTPEVLSIVARNAHAPVFTITDAFVKKEGGVGGYLFSYDKLGREAGRIAREMINGRPSWEIKVDSGSFYQHIYDWQELKRWHLTGSKVIPPGSIFYNKDTSFLIMYEWYILAVLAFLATQTLLIIFLIRMNKRQKVITAKMLETETMHRELIRADRLSKMSTLTASLSHELYQPLAAIRFTAQAGKRFIQTGKLDMNRAFKMFENILEDDIRATGIISSVKSLMKIETREKENVNLNALITETIDIIRADATRNGIRINLKFNSDPVFVFGDKIQLQQVLMNFLRNATSAMENNDPGNRILEVILRLSRDSVTVSVCDSGPGLDTTIKENLFKPFITTKKEGFGIGLTLCKSIIEKHNGKIWAENIPQGGTLFSFSLQVMKMNT